MVAHNARKSSPVRLHSAIGDHLVVNLPREREVCRAVMVHVTERPTDAPVDGEWRNPKPALARAAPTCLLVRAGPAKNLTRPSSVVRRSFAYSSQELCGFVDQPAACPRAESPSSGLPHGPLWCCRKGIHASCGRTVFNLNLRTGQTSPNPTAGSRWMWAVSTSRDVATHLSSIGCVTLTFAPPLSRGLPRTGISARRSASRARKTKH